MKRRECAEAGHAGALDGLSLVMSGLPVYGNGSLRIDENNGSPKMVWAGNPSSGTESPSRIRQIAVSDLRTLEDFSAEVTCPGWEAYEPRMKFLRNESQNDGVVINRASEFDFKEFIRATPNFRKGSLVLMDNGNLRATWKDHCGNRLGLQFLGERMVQYVIFRKRRGEKMVSRVTGRDSFEGIVRQIDAFDLQAVLHE